MTLYKYLITAVFLLLFAISATAQDTIYLRNREFIFARVTSATVYSVKYTLGAAGDSVLHRLPAGKVDRVVFQDGHMWVYNPAHIRQIEKKEARRSGMKPARRSYPNVITLNFPTYQDIGHYPGIAVGFEFERFLDAKSRFSVSLSIERAWAGTNASGKLRQGEVRANIQSWYFTPGFFYHPAGNNKGFDLALGASFPLGSVRRHDTHYYSTSGSYKPPSTDMLAAALAEVNFSVHSPGHFVFTTSMAAGPLISAGETRGALVLFGFKLGSRF